MQVFTGCMFCGKSEALISTVSLERYSQREVVCFKPKADNRYAPNHIISHTAAALLESIEKRMGSLDGFPTIQAMEIVKEEVLKTGLECYPVESADEIRDVLKGKAPDVGVAIDEFQFFDPASRMVEYLESETRNGRRIFIAGLDLDSRGCPFGPMPDLLAISQSVVKLAARCSVCGRQASRSYRLAAGGDQVKVGGASEYEPRCLEHWEPR